MNGDRTPEELVRALRSGSIEEAESASAELVRRGGGVVPHLLEGAADPIDEVRERFVWTLARIGTPETIPYLIAGFSDPDEQTRDSAAVGLGWMGAVALPSVRDAMASHDPLIRAGTARALGLMHCVKAAEGLVESLLADPVDTVRAAAAAACSELIDPSETLIARLALLLSDGAPIVRARAADALLHLGLPAADHLPALRAAMADAEPSVRVAAARAVGQLGLAEETLPILLDALEGEDRWLREEAARALEWLGPAAAGSVERLTALLDGPASGLAVTVLRSIGPGASEAVGALAARLPAADNPRSSIAYALGAIGKSAVPALIGCLNDARPIVRAGAAFALSEVRPTVAQAAGPLMRLLDDLVEDVRSEAIHALGHLGQHAAGAVDQLLGARMDPDASVRGIALWAVRHIGGLSAAKHGATLIESLGDESEYVRHQAAMALGAVPDADQAIVHALITAIADPDPFTRRAAVRALGQLGPRAVEATRSLEGAMADDIALVRTSAAWALVRVGNAGPGMAVLTEALYDEDPHVRAEALRTLADLGAIDGDTLDHARVLLDDPDAEVRAAALAVVYNVG